MANSIKNSCKKELKNKGPKKISSNLLVYTGLLLVKN